MITEKTAAIAEPLVASHSKKGHRFRIAHLSDLHFGRAFDAQVWAYVKGVLTEHRPDLLVITGDIVDSPNLFQMGLVKQELNALAQDLGCHFLVVPGNHDVAILGNVVVWPWRANFRVVFSNANKQRFADLCTFSEFQKFPRVRQIGYRVLWWMKLTALRIVLCLPDPGESAFEIMNADAGNGRAIFACFNSNDRLWLASGRVSHDAIFSLDRELEKLSRNGEAGWLAPRIALAHHHAIPIPYSTTIESLTAFEPFLTMRNAGTLLQELEKLEFDMLLHGHKHFWNFARLSFSSPGRRASEMAIIAAGSATVKQTNAGANSLNLIDLKQNGLIVHRPLFFGQGKTVQDDAEDSKHGERALLTLEQVKERAYRKAVKHLQCNSDCVEREIRIDETGSANFGIRVYGYRALGSRRTRQARLHVSINSGGINPKSVALDPAIKSNGHYLNFVSAGLSTRQLVVPVDLGSELYEGRKDSVDFGIQCRTMNNFAITEWEASMFPGASSSEWAGVVIRQPTRKARLVVEIPNDVRDLGFEPEIVCQHPSNYPALSFDEYGEVNVPAEEDAWVEDHDFTSLEKNKLTVYFVDPNTGAKILARGNHESQPPAYRHTRCEVTIDQPMVGFRYLVRWAVKSRAADCPAETKGNVMELRSALLSMRRDVTLASKLANVRDFLQEALGEIFEDVLRPTFRSRYRDSEKLVASVHVHNSETKSLDLLFEAGAGGNLSGRCEAIPLNEGVVGRVFKTRKFALYVHPDLVGKEHDGLYVYYEQNRPPEKGDEFTALAALPLYWAQYEQLPVGSSDSGPVVPPEAMIGVLTLGSNAFDTELMGLRDGEGKEGQMDMLLTLTESFVSGLAAKLNENGLEESA